MVDRACGDRGVSHLNRNREVKLNIIDEIDRLVAETQEELNVLDSRRQILLSKIQALKDQKISLLDSPTILDHASPSLYVTKDSPTDEKLALFMSLFKGRQDVFPRRFESSRTGKSGYQPVCRNEWIKGRCRKPVIKCPNCSHREFVPLTEEIIRNHLLGYDPQDRSRRDFTIGVYPLLTDETCWFLAADFDKVAWTQDITAFLNTCESYNVPAIIERSRSGKGGHVWIFFSEPVPATLARQLGSFILTRTMETRPEIGLDSYDRFFPSQDTLPVGGFGNLIALPLQKKPRDSGNSVFLDKNFEPYLDQWTFLSSVRRMERHDVDDLVGEAVRRGRVLGVRMPVMEENEDDPWTAPPSRRARHSDIVGPLPAEIELVLGNQIYVSKEDLSPSLRNRLIRLAAFQNPEFYKAQAMRFPTFDKPRIISCCEEFPKHLGIPRGCLEEVSSLFESLDIKARITDKRFPGTKINIRFKGSLLPQQKDAAERLLKHDTGTLAASTAFGKTVVACYLIARRRVNTLILVHRRQLLDQWIARLQDFLDLPMGEIGQIGGGKRNTTGTIDVAIIQSLSKKGTVDDIVDDYGHLIVDECHHISARSFEIVARQSKARYITGSSATVTRKDGHHPIIFMSCGPIRYKLDDREHAASRPFIHRVVTRDTGFTLPQAILAKENLSIQEIYSVLINDEGRNHMIVRDVIEAIGKKRSPVVLSERRDHLEYLSKRFLPQVRNVFLMQGGMGKKQRYALLQEMAKIPDDEERIILATGRYLGEGFDDARLDTLFLTLPISWRGTLAQYAGRLHRSYKTKTEVIIYDYADLSVPMLSKMYERRCKGYKSMGYET